MNQEAEMTRGRRGFGGSKHRESGPGKGLIKGLDEGNSNGYQL